MVTAGAQQWYIAEQLGVSDRQPAACADGAERYQD
jgi:hypothetical protein